ncbi:MAG: group III truncated hemoglobin [Actinobacteria bacterium]|nr:group III truncated hemoglobin [Actinomycetota bacterium]
MIGEDARHDITGRADIELLVRNFYRDAAMDDLLGPVFEAAQVNWNAHIATLVDFWAWQVLGQPGYEGQPLRAHQPVHDRTPLTHGLHERWLELFCDTVDASFRGARAELTKGRGRKMSAAMERLLAGPGSDQLPDDARAAMPVTMVSRPASNA